MQEQQKIEQVVPNILITSSPTSLIQSKQAISEKPPPGNADFSESIFEGVSEELIQNFEQASNPDDDGISRSSPENLSDATQEDLPQYQNLDVNYRIFNTFTGALVKKLELGKPVNDYQKQDYLDVPLITKGDEDSPSVKVVREGPKPDNIFESGQPSSEKITSIQDLLKLINIEGKEEINVIQINGKRYILDLQDYKFQDSRVSGCFAQNLNRSSTFGRDYQPKKQNLREEIKDDYQRISERSCNELDEMQSQVEETSPISVGKLQRNFSAFSHDSNDQRPIPIELTLSDSRPKIKLQNVEVQTDINCLDGSVKETKEAYSQTVNTSEDIEGAFITQNRIFGDHTLSVNSSEKMPMDEKILHEIQKQCALQIEESNFLSPQDYIIRAVSTPYAQNNKQAQPFLLNSHSSMSDSGILALPPPTMKRIQSLDDRGQQQSHLHKKVSDMSEYERNLMQRQLQEANELQSSRKLQDYELHLALLFATPLVVNKRGFGENIKNFKDFYKPQPLLEYKQEFHKILQAIKKQNRRVKVCSMQATLENFTKILGKRPLALHFTGHGLENKRASGKIEKCLLLEEEDGDSFELNEHQLQEIIKSSKAELEFVFVASCYSEFAGRIFHSMGVKHVIVVKQNNTIADQACIEFSDTFYYYVFNQKYTICDSFTQAKNVVNSKFGKEEASKFIMLEATELQNAKLREEAAAKNKKQNKMKMPKGMANILGDEEFNIELPEDFGIPNKKFADSSQEQSQDHKFEEIKHECKILGPFERGKMQNLNQEPIFKQIPSQVQNFVGRQVELFEVVHTVANHRLVSIIGMPGIGKTALAKNAVHYMQDRNMFKLGIIFFSVKGYKNSSIFMKKLVTQIILSRIQLKPEEKDNIHQSNQENLTQDIISYFRGQEDKLLVVFDNAEDLRFFDYKGFIQLITQLLGECENLHFLLTSRSEVGVLQDIEEKVIILQELAPGYAVDLFLQRARQIDDAEKLELINYKPERVIPTGSDSNRQSKIDYNLSNHHLFKLLAGNPHAIILAAPLLIKNRTLKDLYILLNSDNLTENLKVDGVTDSTVTSFCLSIETSVMILQQEDQYALQFFFLIGLLPGGILKDEIKGLWKNSNEKDMGYEHHIDTLLKMSLLQCKEQEGDQKIILPPFINNFAEQRIDQKLKSIFQNQICHYYAEKCKLLYKLDFNDWKNSNQPSSDRVTIENDFISDLRHDLIAYETNIWACIYRMSNTDKPIEFDQLDLQALGLAAQGDSEKGSKLKSQIFRRNFTQAQKSTGSEQLYLEEVRDGTQHQSQVIERTQKIGIERDSFLSDKIKEEFEASVNEDHDSQKCFSNHKSSSSQHSGCPQNVKILVQDLEEDQPLNEEPQQDQDNDSNQKPNQQENEKLNIMKSSFINFVRSIINIKSDTKEVEEKIENNILSRKSFLLTNAPQTKYNLYVPGNQRSLSKMTECERLVIYYGMNLYLIKDDEIAFKLINQYVALIQGSFVFEANVQRLLGLLHLRRLEFTEAQTAFKTAMNLYINLKSNYGQGLCHYSLGVVTLLDPLRDSQQQQEALEHFESALDFFKKECNHKVGQILCHKNIAEIYLKIEDDRNIYHSEEKNRLEREYQDFISTKSRKHHPYINRVYGDDISLMTEIVIDNDNNELFMEMSLVKKSASCIDLFANQTLSSKSQAITPRARKTSMDKID